MKINNILKSFLFIAFITIFTSCTDSDKPYDIVAKDVQTYTLTTTKTVADIYTWAAAHNGEQYTANDFIEAYVTSNDAAGNFYKSISFQDVPTASGTPIGFSVAVNKAMTFADGFYPGRKVYIRLKDLYIGILYGSMKIGMDSSLNGLEPFDYLKSLFPSATVLNEDLLVRHMSLADARLNANQNTLLEVDGVQFANSSLNRTYFDIDSGGYATNHTIEDPYAGTTNICRVSQYAPFSVNKVLSGKGSIRGVMTKYNTDFQYLVRAQSDFKLKGARFVPILFDDFSNGISDWNAYSVTGAQVWATTTYGNPAPGALMTGYSGGNKANEDWLISKKLDLTSYTSATLTFDTAAKYGGNNLEIYISKNYSGSGNPSSATWTPLSANLSPVNGNFVWTNSGNIALNSFTGVGAGNVYIAFKYTSTTSAAASWELDNVKIIGN
jgi:hypothetical protein